MCFSATASIASAGVLLMMGIASLKKAMPQKNLYPFAALPIFFGIQQACEWMVWTGFNTSNQTYIYYGSSGFLFFGLIFWPFWIPFSLYHVEQKPLRKKILGWITVMAIGYSASLLYLGCCSFTTLISNHHVSYGVPGLDPYTYVLTLLYVAFTVLSFFIASHHLLWIFGLSLFFAFIASLTMFAGTIISIWCFFAAILSILVWVIIRNLAQHKHH